MPAATQRERELNMVNAAIEYEFSRGQPLKDGPLRVARHQSEEVFTKFASSHLFTLATAVALVLRNRVAIAVSIAWHLGSQFGGKIRVSDIYSYSRWRV